MLADPLKADIIESELFFNTQFLTKYDLVAQTLINKENFQEVFFQSSDGLQLNGLFRKKADAPYSIIFCAGFYPGRKEGLASFVKLVPENINILFFDARGHGKSEGRFFTNISNYGIDEYKDIIGAIQFMHKETANKPLFIHGICAGAFHATHALARIDTTHYQIKGFIFDSGLESLLNACTVPEKHFREKVIPSLLQKIYTSDSKKKVKERYLCKLLSSLTCTTIRIVTTLVKPSLEKREHTMALGNHLNKITCPIFFIHSYDDSYCPIQCIKDLTENASSKMCWWLNQSEHALNHIKHKDEYQKQLNIFIANTIV